MEMRRDPEKTRAFGFAGDDRITAFATEWAAKLEMGISPVDV